MGYTFAIYETVRINRGDWHIHTAPEKDHLEAFLMTLFTFQVSDGIMHAPAHFLTDSNECIRL